MIDSCLLRRHRPGMDVGAVSLVNGWLTAKVLGLGLALHSMPGVGVRIAAVAAARRAVALE